MTSAEVYSSIILVQLVSVMSSLAVFVFQMHLVMNKSYFIPFQIDRWQILLQQFKHIDFDFATLLIAVGFYTLNLFIYCYFGKLATESFENMANHFFESNWYELPIDLQKYFVMMIGNAQRPIHYHGSGIAILNLDTFKNVCAVWFHNENVNWLKQFRKRFDNYSGSSSSLYLLHGASDSYNAVNAEVLAD